MKKFLPALHGRGFTLIELMVVISIIAILSIVAIGAFGGVQRGARNSKRQSDLKLIQSALEDYHADQLYYPDGRPPDKICAPSENGFLELFCPLKSPDGRRIYLNKIPNDPKDYPPYCYIAEDCDRSLSPPKCKSYHISTFLEGPQATITDCGLDNTFNLQVTRP